MTIDCSFESIVALQHFYLMLSAQITKVPLIKGQKSVLANVQVIQDQANDDIDQREATGGNAGDSHV